MLFNVAGHEVKSEVEKKHTFKSKHSENTLEKLKIHFQVYNRRKVPKTILSVDDGRKWKVINSSYYYTEGNPVIRYIFELEEIEELNIKVLHLNDLKLRPYIYDEEINEDRGNSLIIKAQTELDEKSWGIIEQLYSTNNYFTVKRDGISPKKKEMRFGKIIWSRTPKNTIKCALSLFEKNYDDFKEQATLKPENDNLGKTALQNTNTINALIEILKTKNLLNKEDIQKIESLRNEIPKTLKFGEVDDLEEFMERYEL
jgi:hypothetical protein